VAQKMTSWNAVVIGLVPRDRQSPAALRVRIRATSLSLGHRGVWTAGFARGKAAGLTENTGKFYLY
jgi:hypothetical protein